jgi:serine/threonine-protein kinase
MGEVWRVHDRLLSRTLVRKVLRIELASDERALARFTNEARITAHLQHPGVVPVYDIGVMDDGRPFYTMQQVRGPRLHDVLETWSLRRLVGALRRVADVLALAHSRGVIHRDLKPDNVMVGEFGSVILLDWGIARAAPPIGVEAFPGSLVGTGPYLAPEMAQRRFDDVGPHSDVFQMGCLLYEVLVGRPPRAGPTVEVVHRAARDPVVPPTQGDPGLLQICRDAVAWDIGDRTPDGAALAKALGDWLEGADRRERALGVVASATQRAVQADRLQAQANAAQARARQVLEPLSPYDDASAKAPGWALEDQAESLRGRAALQADHHEQDLHAALRIDPELAEAHAALAQVYRSRHEQAEAASATLDAARWEQRLRAHDRGAHTDYLAGQGTLTLRTAPPARARLFRYDTVGRRLTAVHVRDLCETPIVDLVLPHGSYVVELSPASGPTVRVPALIQRAKAWPAPPPSGADPVVRLPAALGPDEVFVPQGWFTFGGDPDAADALPGTRAWLDAFVIARHPVTVGEYLEFLNDQVERGVDVDALAPTDHGLSGPGEQVNYGRDGDRFVLRAPGCAAPWTPNLPISNVTWWAAAAYAVWRSERDGQPWRLPHSLEWEKAVRGVDARPVPWGSFLEPTWACTVDTVPTRPDRVSVTAFPVDRSPYGLRGAVGNVRDLCADTYAKHGPSLRQGRLTGPVQHATDPELWRNTRGGCMISGKSLVRPCTRFAVHPDHRFPGVGFRLARPTGR